MSTNNPLFSVVCPVYNSEEYILEALESVLSQTLPPDEIIVIDDGSTDNTLKIVNDLELANKNKIEIIKSEHKGPGSARNIGIERSKSTWIAFLDSDDIWKENKLEIVSKNIISNPLNDIFCHSEYHLDLNGSLKLVNYGKTFNYSKKLINQLFLRNFFSTSAVVCKKELVDKFGGFDEEMMNAQDYDLWLKISQKANPFFIDDGLGVYRIRKGNITSGSIEKKFINLFKILVRYRSNVPNTPTI